MDMPSVTLVFPQGMFGASPHDTVVETAMRVIAEAASSDPKGEWAEKYGTDADNAVFMMHRYCWCEQDGCAWCVSLDDPDEHAAPNFWHKPSGFKVWWYKYIGRSMETVGAPPADLIEQCLASLEKPE